MTTVHPLQPLIDTFNEHTAVERAAYHLTLGALKVALDDAPPTLPVTFEDGVGVGCFQSYRGYYTDISLTDGKPKFVEDFRRRTDKALITTFTGYKGGDFPARPGKALWRSNWGEASGVAIIGFEICADAFVLVTRKVE